MRLAIVVVPLVAAVAALAVVACGSNKDGADAGPGKACTSTLGCPTGYVCDLTDPAGSDCIDGSGDLDGDGIDNAHDFCDHMPGGQYDEDGDGIGDICDRCPIAPPPATPDSDHDGVDSPCDPYPDSDGDSIFLFDGFNGTLGSNWVASPAGGWQIEGGELVVTQGSDVDATMTFPLPMASNHFAVLSAYRIDALPMDTAFHEVALTGADTTPAGVSKFHCGSLRTTTGDSLQVSTDMNETDMPEDNLFDTAGLFQLTARQDASEAGCVVIGDNEQGAIQTPVSVDAMSQAALAARDLTARFEYILIVGH